MLASTSIHEEITQRVIGTIEQGQVPPWRRPISDFENDGFPTHPSTLRPFKGVNALLMNMAATAKGFRSKFWANEDGWRYLDSQVSGEATILADGTPVFNADQLLLSRSSVAYRSRKRRSPVVVDYSPAEAVIKASGADIRHVHGLEAAYYYEKDFIIFPHKWQFVEGPGGIEAYYDSLFHELAGHWTEPRLRWSASPIVNEMRAEFAAPFTTAQLGLPVFAEMEKLVNHCKHLDRWVRAMHADPTLIFKVAHAASQGVEYLLSLRG
jgi:antirestriction protein ArdC